MDGVKDWKYLLASVYAIICIFDFIIVPAWFGVTRVTFDAYILKELTAYNVEVQLAMLKAYTFQHEPFTLKGSGLFHLSFGALLTGSAIVGNKK